MMQIRRYKVHAMTELHKWIQMTRTLNQTQNKSKVEKCKCGFHRMISNAAHK